MFDHSVFAAVYGV